jgi:hypothetical protein
MSFSGRKRSVGPAIVRFAPMLGRWAAIGQPAATSSARSLSSAREGAGKRMIGVFDSGLGGLTILRALHARFPRQAFVYLGDQANAPYGDRPSRRSSRSRARGSSKLFDRGARLVVLGCNTATAVALRALQRDWLPQAQRPGANVVGIVAPTVEAATQTPFSRHDAAISAEEQSRRRRRLRDDANDRLRRLRRGDLQTLSAGDGRRPGLPRARCRDRGRATARGARRDRRRHGRCADRPASVPGASTERSSAARISRSSKSSSPRSCRRARASSPSPKSSPTASRTISPQAASAEKKGTRMARPWHDLVRFSAAADSGGWMR